MPKNVLRLYSDRQVMSQGDSVEILALIDTFRSRSGQISPKGIESIKQSLWGRWDGLDVVGLLSKAGLPFEAHDIFKATRIAGTIHDETAQKIIQRLEALEASGLSLTTRTANGATLMHTLSNAFHPAIMALLESRGLDPLEKAAEGSAFSLVLMHTENLARDQGLTDELEESLALEAKSAWAQHEQHVPQEGGTDDDSEGFGMFEELRKGLRKDIDNEKKSLENRLVWLEHCMALGAQLHPSRHTQRAGSANAAALLGFNSALNIFRRVGEEDCEAFIRSRLEAAALRHACQDVVRSSERSGESSTGVGQEGTKGGALEAKRKRVRL